MKKINLEKIRDESARSYCKSIQMYYLKRQEGSYDTLMKYEVSEYIIEAHESGFDRAIKYIRAQAIQEIIDWVFKNGYEDTFPTDDLVEHFESDLKILNDI